MADEIDRLRGEVAACPGEPTPVTPPADAGPHQDRRCAPVTACSPASPRPDRVGRRSRAARAQPHHREPESEGRPMTVRVEASVDAGRPIPATAFAAVVDLPSQEKWIIATRLYRDRGRRCRCRRSAPGWPRSPGCRQHRFPGHDDGHRVRPAAPLGDATRTATCCGASESCEVDPLPATAAGSPGPNELRPAVRRRSAGWAGRSPNRSRSLGLRASLRRMARQLGSGCAAADARPRTRLPDGARCRAMTAESTDGRRGPPAAGRPSAPDDRARCWWGASAPEYIEYHDHGVGTCRCTATTRCTNGCAWRRSSPA